jgi:hypothetical protein
MSAADATPASSGDASGDTSGSAPRQAAPMAADDPLWEDAQRLEGFAGEIRLNRIRLAAIIVFYVRHLAEVYLWRQPGSNPAGGRYHLEVSAAVVFWVLEVIALHWRLSRGQVPARLKFLSTGWDLLMVTVLAALAGGPVTPLVLLYFLVIASAPLRLSLRLVYFATGGAVLGYLALLMYFVLYVIGRHRYYATPQLRIPRKDELIFVLELLAAGVLAGQAVRQARRLVRGHAVVAADALDASALGAIGGGATSAAAVAAPHPVQPPPAGEA